MVRLAGQTHTLKAVSLFDDVGHCWIYYRCHKIWKPLDKVSIAAPRPCNAPSCLCVFAQKSQGTCGRDPMSDMQKRDYRHWRYEHDKGEPEWIKGTARKYRSFAVSNVSNCLREASNIWVEVDWAASWPSRHYLKKDKFLLQYLLLTALGMSNPQPSELCLFVTVWGLFV